MSDRLDDTPTQDTAEASSESTVSEAAEPETADSQEAAAEESETAAVAESEPKEAQAEAAEETEPEVAQAEAAGDAEPEAAQVEASEEATEPEPVQAEAAEEAAEPVQAEAAEEAAEPVQAEAAEEAAEPVQAEAAEEAAEPPVQAEAAEEAAEPVQAEAAGGEEKPEDAQAETQPAEAAGAEAAVAAASAVDKAEAGEAMVDLEKAMTEKKLVKGQVIGWNKGGYHVAIGKIAAFCPVSQIEIGNPRGPKRYLDKTFAFRIIEIQNGGRRVVLSRAEAIKAEREQRAGLVRDLLQPGAELEGKVSSLTDFGAFVDLGGGIEGLVHVSEISRRRVEHPKEALRNGQKVKVTVLKIEKGGQRISLSMKRLEPDPWRGAATRYPAGSEFTGTVLRHTDFGVFIEVEPGLEGLVHTSRLALGMTMSDERLEVGKEISGWIHEVEGKRRRLSLALREVAGGNPWQGITDRYPVGDVFKGTVERLTNFGVFIQLEPGLTGLLPFSVLGIAAGGNPRRQYHVGKEVPIRILGIDRDKRRISLGTESSKAEGNQQDYREYKKTQTRSTPSGMNAMAAAFAKLKNSSPQAQ